LRRQLFARIRHKWRARCESPTHLRSACRKGEEACEKDPRYSLLDKDHRLEYDLVSLFDLLSQSHDPCKSELILCQEDLEASLLESEAMLPEIDSATSTHKGIGDPHR
jgi:hypothetical protein